MTGFPKGARDEELVRFALEHPSGLEAVFSRVGPGEWELVKVAAPEMFGFSTVKAQVNALISDIERQNDAVVVNRKMVNTLQKSSSKD